MFVVLPLQLLFFYALRCIVPKGQKQKNMLKAKVEWLEVQLGLIIIITIIIVRKD